MHEAISEDGVQNQARYAPFTWYWQYEIKPTHIGHAQATTSDNVNAWWLHLLRMAFSNMISQWVTSKGYVLHLQGVQRTMLIECTPTGIILEPGQIDIQGWLVRCWAGRWLASTINAIHGDLGSGWRWCSNPNTPLAACLPFPWLSVPKKQSMGFFFIMTAECYIARYLSICFLNIGKRKANSIYPEQSWWYHPYHGRSGIWKCRYAISDLSHTLSLSGMVWWDYPNQDNSP